MTRRHPPQVLTLGDAQARELLDRLTKGQSQLAPYIRPDMYMVTTARTTPERLGHDYLMSERARLQGVNASLLGLADELRAGAAALPEDTGDRFLADLFDLFEKIEAKREECDASLNSINKNMTERRKNYAAKAERFRQTLKGGNQ
jgi:hypothetical protein